MRQGAKQGAKSSDLSHPTGVTSVTSVTYTFTMTMKAQQPTTPTTATLALSIGLLREREREIANTIAAAPIRASDQGRENGQ